MSQSPADDLVFPNVPILTVCI